MDDFTERARKRAEDQNRRNGTGPLPPGTGPLSRRHMQGASGGDAGPSGGNGSLPQGNPFVVRLDPSRPGEFNFTIAGPEDLTARVPQAGLIAESSAGIPPQLFKAVDEVLGFIYGLDQQFESRGRRPGK